jgi:hypothetical protein
MLRMRPREVREKNRDCAWVIRLKTAKHTNRQPIRKNDNSIFNFYSEWRRNEERKTTREEARCFLACFLAYQFCCLHDAAKRVSATENGRGSKNKNKDENEWTTGFPYHRKRGYWRLGGHLDVERRLWILSKLSHPNDEHFLYHSLVFSVVFLFEICFREDVLFCHNSLSIS